MNIHISNTHLFSLQNNYPWNFWESSWKNSDGKETLNHVAKSTKLKVAGIYRFKIRKLQPFHKLGRESQIKFTRNPLLPHIHKNKRKSFKIIIKTLPISLEIQVWMDKLITSERQFCYRETYFDTRLCWWMLLYNIYTKTITMLWFLEKQSIHLFRNWYCFPIISFVQ